MIPRIPKSSNNVPFTDNQSYRINNKTNRLKTFLAILGIVFALILTALVGLYFLGSTSKEPTRDSSTSSKPTAISPEIKLALNNLKSSVETGINQQDYTKLVIALKTSVATYGDSLSSNQLSKINTITKDYDMSVQLWRSSYTNDDGGSIIDLGSMGSYESNSSLDVAALSAWMRSKHLDIPEHGPHSANEVMSQVWGVISAEVDNFFNSQ